MTDTDATLVEGLTRWVAQESPTREAAAVNAMVDMVAAEAAAARAQPR